MNVSTLLLLSAVLLLSSCENEAPFVLSHETVVQLTSPNGCCVVTVSETQFQNRQSTGISFDFIEYGGGFHVLSFEGSDLDLQLKWIDSENLEIRYPKGVPFYGATAMRIDGNTTIERVEFYKRTVDIHLVRESTNDAISQETPSK